MHTYYYKLDEMDKFPDRHQLPILTQKIQNMNPIYIFSWSLDSENTRKNEGGQSVSSPVNLLLSSAQ